MSRPISQKTLLLILAGVSLLLPWPGQTSPAGPPQQPSLSASSGSAKPLRIREIAIEHEKDGLALAITSNGALIPTITRLNGPPRLVIDLPGAVTAAPNTRIPVQAGEIKAIRVNQHVQNPPLTRVVVDLDRTRNYVWETVQNKLVIHLRPTEEAEKENPPPLPPVPENSPGSLAPAQEPATVVASPAGNPALVSVGSQSGAGWSLTASSDTALLNLARGGQIRVCQGTTISVTRSQSGRELMLAMSTGALEADYSLSTSADSILTPDFRIVLPGPGQFHFAVSADSKGNTCVRSLPGNTASAVVSELMGDGTYRVKPNEQVVFHSGQLTMVDNDIPIDCGCPASQTPVMRAEAEAPAPLPDADEAATAALPANSPLRSSEVAKTPAEPLALEAQPSRPTLAQVTVAGMPPETAAAAPQPRGVHVQVDAPLVFRASDRAHLPAPIEEVAQLPPVSSSRSSPIRVVVLPPAPRTRPLMDKPRTGAQTGFFGHIKHFFKALFG